MGDVIVTGLQYGLKTAESLRFTDPDPIHDETEEFSVVLADDTVSFELKKPCDSLEAARGIVEGYLEAWKIEYNASTTRGMIEFEYREADVIARADSRDDDGIRGTLTGSVQLTGSIHILVKKGSYPAPPAIAATPDVRSIYQRYMGYRKNAEPLQSMAHFCLTIAEDTAGGRREAARRYTISRNVLNKLGYLVSQVGDAATARKADRKEDRPLTEPEIRWIDAVIRRLMIRMGECAADPQQPLPQLDMSDFPSL